MESTDYGTTKVPNGGLASTQRPTTDGGIEADAPQKPRVALETYEQSPTQTLIGFSGPGVDGGALAIPDPNLSKAEAIEIARAAVQATGGGA